MLVSLHIGAKVMLNTFTALLGYAPTKVRIFKAELGSNANEVLIEEILSKGACPKKLLDYDIHENTMFFIAQYSD